jgi:hypothetical protein
MSSKNADWKTIPFRSLLRPQGSLQSVSHFLRQAGSKGEHLMNQLVKHVAMALSGQKTVAKCLATGKSLVVGTHPLQEDLAVPLLCEVAMLHGENTSQGLGYPC